MSGEDLFVLVHGTFASEATWIQEDSAIARALIRASPRARTMAFRWSGENSHQARLKAGLQLATFVNKLCEMFPAVRIHIVAHSHGGNVAMYALQGASKPIKPESITFLGTPFLVPLPIKFDQEFTIEQLGVHFGCLILPALAIFPPLMMLFRYLSVDISLFWLLVITAMVAFAGLGIGRYIREEYLPRVAARRIGTQEQVAALLDQRPPACRVYIATVPGDEAGALLNVVDAVTFAPRRLIDYLKAFLAGIILGGAVVFVASAIGQNFVQGLGDVASDIATLLLVFCIVMSIVSIGAFQCVSLVASAVRGSGIAFGGEDRTLVSSVRIRARTHPSWPLPHGSVDRVYRFSDPGGWSHCAFYDDPKVLGDLSEWIGGKPEKQDRPAGEPSESGGEYGSAVCAWAGIVAALVFSAVILWFVHTSPEDYYRIRHDIFGIAYPHRSDAEI